MTLHLVLRFLHILSASLWIGSALSWPGALRRALADTPPRAEPALAQARTGLALDLAFGLATLATGVLYMAIVEIPLRHGFEAGFGLAVLRIVLLFALARPALSGIAQGLAAGDAGRARAAARKLPAYAGAAHLLWLLALVGMVWPV
ncbi:MAG TPA: hypothetical protein VF805_14120 [Anaeromyxobacteraceae bacterium]